MCRQKSPTCHQEEPYVPSRKALHAIKRALHAIKRAQHAIKKSPTCIKRVLQVIKKSPTCHQWNVKKKSPTWHPKNPEWRVPGLPVRDCARSCNNGGPRRLKLSAINKSSVNPKSTSNQSSKPCTVLQYPSKKSAQEGVTMVAQGGSSWAQ